MGITSCIGNGSASTGRTTLENLGELLQINSSIGADGKETRSYPTGRLRRSWGLVIAQLASPERIWKIMVNCVNRTVQSAQMAKSAPAIPSPTSSRHLWRPGRVRAMAQYPHTDAIPAKLRS